MKCEWCGSQHRPDALCTANTVQMTRRKFLFLFGVGVAGAAIASQAGAGASFIEAQLAAERGIPRVEWETFVFDGAKWVPYYSVGAPAKAPFYMRGRSHRWVEVPERGSVIQVPRAELALLRAK